MNVYAIVLQSFAIVGPSNWNKLPQSLTDL